MVGCDGATLNQSPTPFTASLFASIIKAFNPSSASMKRCPECRRDYHDETLLYCLDDGTPLLDGPSSGNRATEAPTAILQRPTIQYEADTVQQLGADKPASGISVKWLVVGIIAAALVGS